MMNPLNFLQMFRNTTPQQFIQQAMNNSQMMQNPMIKNTMELAQKGDMQGIEQMARNLCKEKGVNPDELMNQIKSGFNHL